MEAFALYLLKSVIWLAGFALVFILFLRNERFFFLNRIFLIAGILTSFFFPLMSIHYTVVLPVVSSVQSDGAVVSKIQNTGTSIIPALRLILSVLYLLGVLTVFTIIIRQGRSVLRTIKKSEVLSFHPVKLIRTTDYTSAFSFFSYVFVNPSVTDIETKEIMNHELVHIRQKHSFDLVLVQLLCMMQWFNPLVWIYVRFIRQNHEYLADEVALQRTSDPAIYRAALINQIVGAPVVSLANSFNYSLNKKRFNMMKNIISSPYRKMKILFILPVFAVVLYAFAKPDYKYKIIDQSSGNPVLDASQVQHEVTGTVVQKNGNPLSGAIITLKNTTIGTITDASGSFKFVNVPDDGVLYISYTGFKSKAIKPDFKAPMRIEMEKETVKSTDINISTPPPPPPPPPGLDIRNIDNPDAPPPLYIVDGAIATPADVKKIDPELIGRIDVLKDKGNDNRLTDEYGDKAKNGVVMITTKKKVAESGDMIAPPPPPPPPPSITTMFSNNGPKPLFVVEGKITSAADVEKIDPNSIESINVLKDKSSADKYGAKGKDGAVEIILKKEIKGSPNQLPGVPPPPPPYKVKSDQIRQDGPPPLYVVDGIIMTPEEADKITPDKIESVNVLKLAADKYGEKGKNGAVEITTKEKVAKMLVIIDGVVYEKDGGSKINMNELKSMTVLTEKQAIEKYGEKGKYGAIEVTNFQVGEKRPVIKTDSKNGVMYDEVDKKKAPFVVEE